MRGGLPVPVYGGKIQPTRVPRSHLAGGSPPKDALGNPARRSGCHPLPVPLQPEDENIVLDLQGVIDTVYDRAGYDLDINYNSDPDSPPRIGVERLGVSPAERERSAPGLIRQWKQESRNNSPTVRSPCIEKEGHAERPRLQREALRSRQHPPPPYQARKGECQFSGFRISLLKVQMFGKFRCPHRHLHPRRQPAVWNDRVGRLVVTLWIEQPYLTLRRILAPSSTRAGPSMGKRRRVDRAGGLGGCAAPVTA